MEVLIAVFVIIFSGLLFVNIRVTKAIASSNVATEADKKRAVFMVWSVPFFGVLYVSRRVLPFFDRELGSRVSSESLDQSSGNYFRKNSNAK